MTTRPTRRTLIAIAVVVGGCAGVALAGADLASAKTYTIHSNKHGVVTVNGTPLRTVGQLTRMLAERPSASRSVGHGFRCSVRWRSGVTVDAHNFDGDDPCVPRTGYVGFLTASGAKWTTARRLKVGDSLRRLRALYPNADRQQGRWTLTTYSTYRTRNPVISARVVRGRVVDIHASVRAGGP